jgi:hypothetical protein
MTSTAVKELTRSTWQRRAQELAVETQLAHRARYLGQGTHHEELWQVPSKVGDGSTYVVRVWPHSLGVVCGCTAGTYGRPCGHAGAALLAERQKQVAERGSEADTALRWWLHGGEWDR